MRKMWSGNSKVVNPSSFRKIVIKHAKQFDGYQEHDSQEFLAVVLDLLHEDLNRVQKKKYVGTCCIAGISLISPLLTHYLLLIANRGR